MLPSLPYCKSNYIYIILYCTFVFYFPFFALQIKKTKVQIKIYFIFFYKIDRTVRDFYNVYTCIK